MKFIQLLIALGLMTTVAACSTAGDTDAPDAGTEETMPNTEETAPAEDPGMMDEDQTMDENQEMEDSDQPETSN